METKCGIQILHGKCIKPGCSGAANNGDSELFSVDGIVNLGFIAHKLLLLFFLSSLEGATLKYVHVDTELTLSQGF